MYFQRYSGETLVYEGGKAYGVVSTGKQNSDFLPLKSTKKVISYFVLCSFD